MAREVIRVVVLRGAGSWNTIWISDAGIGIWSRVGMGLGSGGDEDVDADVDVGSGEWGVGRLIQTNVVGDTLSVRLERSVCSDVSPMAMVEKPGTWAT